jgi:hypothetical protein
MRFICKDYFVDGVVGLVSAEVVACVGCVVRYDYAVEFKINGVIGCIAVWWVKIVYLIEKEMKDCTSMSWQVIEISFHG